MPLFSGWLRINTPEVNTGIPVSATAASDGVVRDELVRSPIGRGDWNKLRAGYLHTLPNSPLRHAVCRFFRGIGFQPVKKAAEVDTAVEVGKL